MRKHLFLCGFLLFVFLASNSDATVTELIQNGGFETGTFEGWIPLNAEIVTAPDPVYNGSYAAGLSVSEIIEEDGEFCIGPFCVPYSIEVDSNPYSALLLQEIQGFEMTDQMFTASYYYNLDVLKPKGALLDDALYVGYLGVLDTALPPVLIGGGMLVVEGDSNGWQYDTNTVDLSHESLEHLLLGFFFADGLLTGGGLDYSSAFLDDISVTANAVPEPASMFLLASGFLGLAALRKRFRT
jgi:hypothetical protein